MDRFTILQKKPEKNEKEKNEKEKNEKEKNETVSEKQQPTKPRQVLTKEQLELMGQSKKKAVEVATEFI
jgi:hypothetical protein